MDNNIIDVDFNEKYYTLEDVSEITNLKESKIVFYCTKLEKMLNITSVGVYQVFRQVDIDNLIKIKSLEDKGMTILEIEKYLEANKSEVLLEKVDKKIDVSFLDFFARVLEVQNNKIDAMININRDLVTALNELNSKPMLLESSLDDVKNEISVTVDDMVSKKMDAFELSMNESLETMNNNAENFNKNLTDEIKDFKAIVRSAYVTEQEIERSKNNSFLSKLTNLFKHN